MRTKPKCVFAAAKVNAQILSVCNSCGVQRHKPKMVSGDSSSPLKEGTRKGTANIIYIAFSKEESCITPSLWVHKQKQIVQRHKGDER